MASFPVETKVKAATLAAFGVGVLITVLNQAQTDAQLLGGLPPWLQAVITVGVPPLVTFLSAWQARHTSRSSAKSVASEDDL